MDEPATKSDLVAAVKAQILSLTLYFGAIISVGIGLVVLILAAR
ncbi:hypothetical protein [Phyllobacterium zundukense]|jgi:hypothetical protein|uniref:Uncharacterized protein n=1 Tax=Phyllobacterium zundukense TaxID=1867719 RepID=A0ACD4D1Y6_9HYPH|nr:hypothetical protein [Phyllobacterium zundukense]UXN59861.1 hypothetical protein N8E88_25400 [Phyllobacterium zundukense]